MISCKRAAELISLSLETPLGWRQRFELATHLAICSMCRRFRRQARLLQRAARAVDDRSGDGATLPDAARDRIKAALHDAGAGESNS